MYITFLDSFSDYKVPFRLNKEQFVRKFVEKLKIDFALSAGVFEQNSMAGFIFSSINYYEGKLTAYNGGTGVRPAYRGRSLTTRMYEYLIPLFKARKVKQCVLEVLTENDRAIWVYENIGFRKAKSYKCFKYDSGKIRVKKPSIDLEIFTVKHPNWHLYDRFSDHKPSFLDSTRMINDNLASETIIETHAEGQCIGYAIFQPAFGRISQLGISPGYRGMGVGANLIKYIQETSHQKILTVINIDEEATSALEFYDQLGFTNQLNQYEMVLSLEES